MLGDHQSLALVGYLDARRVLQAGRKVGEHQLAAVVCLLLAGLLRRAEVPATSYRGHAEDQQDQQRALCHARALARRRLRTMPSTTAAMASNAGTSTMLKIRSSVSRREMSRFKSYCTTRSCCLVSTMSLRAASIAVRCSGVI